MRIIKRAGLSWEQIKQKLESEGAFNIFGLSLNDIIDQIMDASVDGVALVFEGIFSIDFAAKILDNTNMPVDRAAAIINNANLSPDRAASIFNSAYLSVDKAASIFDNANLSVDKAASICDNANLSETKLQEILDNTNLSIQKGQEIVDIMSNPEKIGTGGRRGYVGDDWEDNKLTSRDKAATVATTFDRIFAHFRPEWTTGGTVSASNGYVAITSSHGYLNTPSSFTEGTWELDYKLATGARIGFFFMAQNNFDSINKAYNSYFVFAHSKYELCYYDGSTLNSLISVDTDTRDGNWHTIKVTRDSNGNFELFLDGVSQGTATDTSITTSEIIHVWEDFDTGYNNAEVDCDNLEVY